MMTVGFSGPLQNMTNAQVLQVHMLLGDLKTAGATQVTHSLVKGSSEQFHDMAKALGYFIIGIPVVTELGPDWHRSDRSCDMETPPKAYTVIDMQIVKESDVVIAVPVEVKDPRKRLGPWAAIRAARYARKPLCIVWTDGSGPVEHVSEVFTLDEYRQSIAAVPHA